jgi:hypothetical protein
MQARPGSYGCQLSSWPSPRNVVARSQVADTLCVDAGRMSASRPDVCLLLDGSTTYVRYGSLADIRERIRDVRFTPNNGHAQRRHRCLLSANSGHRFASATVRSNQNVDEFDEASAI